MIQRLALLILTLAFGSSVFAQAPQPISVQGKLGIAGTPLKNDCGNEAGTFTFAPFGGVSNDVAGDTVYLCLGDQILTQSDVSTTLFDGDPNSSTPAGVGYALYSCRPTIEGQNLATVATDPCVIPTGDPANPLIVAASFTNDGNVTFLNDGGLQTQFANGDPAVLWFAPITYDELLVLGGLPIAQYEEAAAGEAAGPCVDVSIDQAFAVAYLNEIVVADISAAQGCRGAFQVQGGLSELDGSRYNVSITLDSDPSVVATLINPGSAVHASRLQFSVPQAGTYNISVTDGKACPATAQITIDQASCSPVVFNLPNTNFPPGTTNVCVDVTVENFNDVLGFQFPLMWDATILEFVSVTNLNANLPTFTLPNSVGDTRVGFGELSIAWADLDNFSQITLADGDVLFSICFNVIGNEGDATDLVFDPNGIPELRAEGENGAILGFQGNNGRIVVSNQSYFLTVNSMDESCDRLDDGSISFDVSGGVAPYTYELVDASNMVVTTGTITETTGSFTFTDLEPGTYQVIVVDSNTSIDVLGEVVASDIITVGMGLRLGVNLELQSGLECAGFMNGVIRAAISENGFAVGSTADYVIEWRLDENGPVEETGAFLRDAEAGLQYYVTVSRGECARTASASFTSPLPLELEIQSLQDATCEGVEDGGIAIGITGGSTLDDGNYSVQWSNFADPISIPALNPAQQGSLEPASYSIAVTDNNGCEESIDFDIAALRSITTTSNVNDVLCFGGEDGNIQVTALAVGTGEARPYDFTWINTAAADPIATDTETTSSIENLGIGTYTLFVQDADGCITEDTLTIVEPEPLVVSANNVQEATCIGGLMNGAIDIATTGGTAPYDYFWPEIAGLTTENAVSLSPGSYEVVVTDANGCTETSMSFAITAPDLPQITIMDGSVECFGDTDGMISATATPGGSAAIESYLWSNGSTAQNLDNLPAGTYTVTVTDAAGCPAIDTAVVIQPDPLGYRFSQVQDPTCPGRADGQLLLEPIGGSGRFVFMLDSVTAGQAEGFRFTNLLGNTSYTFSAIDTNGCDGIMIDTMLTDPIGIDLMFSEIDSTRCFDTADGAATAVALFADGSSGIFDYAWLNSANQRVDNNTTSSRATDLQSGLGGLQVSYESIVDPMAQKCTEEFEIEIPSPERILPIAAAMGVNCFGDTNGTIELTTTGGAAPYRYDWQDNAISGVRTDLAPGTYFVTILDANDCVAQTSAEVLEPAELILAVVDTLTDNSVSCQGDMDAQITVAVSGGNPLGLDPFTWPNGIAGTTDSVAFELLPGTYIITVTDQNDCIATAEHTIIEPDAITAIIPTPEEPDCFGQQTVINIDAAFGGQGGPYSFSVNNRQELELDEMANVFGGQEHVISIFDIRGCQFDTTLFIGQPEQIEVILPDLIEVQLGDSITLDPDVFSVQDIAMYTWSPDVYLSNIDDERPSILPLNDQEYTLIVTDINGCEGRANTTVEVDNKLLVYVPNIFSPNNDGFNDLLQVYTGTGVVSLPSVSIYDRWGELLFHERDLPGSSFGLVNWDGTFKNKEVPEDVYVCIIEIEQLDGSTYTWKSTVTVIR